MIKPLVLEANLAPPCHRTTAPPNPKHISFLPPPSSGILSPSSFLA